MTTLQSQWKRRKTLQISAAFVGSLFLVAACWWSEFSLHNLFTAGPRFAEFFGRLAPPDWSVTTLLLESALETLMIALAGTFLAVLLSLPLGLLAASNVSPPWISHPIKIFLGLIRAIPLILVALIFVAAVGLGPFPGTLAIAFHSTGMLSKFYAEEFETANKGILNAVRGTGATTLQTLRFGLLPQSLPQILAFTIFRLEMNFRDATVLGLVGAGGIGYYITLYVLGFQYEKVGVLLLVIITIVLLLDQITLWARRWIQ